MQLLVQMGHGFGEWLWRASWQASVVILLVLVAQWVFGRRTTPRWRHALWLLVLARLLLPASVTTPVSLFNWLEPRSAPTSMAFPAAVAQGPQVEGTAPEAPTASEPKLLSWHSLGVVWVVGALAIPLYLGVSAFRMSWIIRRQRPVTQGEVLDLLEDCKQSMGVRTPLTLVETPAVQCPALFGFVRPRLLLPQKFLKSFSLAELRYVFLHELAHLKRGDIPVNWLTVLPLMLHWFNPLVWYAFRRMRADGELACDALALAHTQGHENRQYGATIIKLLESFSRPALAPGLVGILENQNQMKRRISMIASFSRARGWPGVATAVFAVLAVLTLTDPQRTTAAASPAGAAEGPPKIVSTTPAVGATEVDPGLKEIRITFDRDMQEGFSWTGGPPDFPTAPEGAKARWIDRRTCALPVQLQAGRYYRVGINSTSFQNFRSSDGVPVRPAAIYFTTKGASDALKKKATKPTIVGLEPRNGAQDVDPNITELRVTFNVPMAGGFSWTGGGEQFPPIPEGKKPSWSADKKSCVLPVKLEAGKSYRLGLNSPSHKNFQSEGGVPLDPVVYQFKTRN